MALEHVSGNYYRVFLKQETAVCIADLSTYCQPISVRSREILGQCCLSPKSSNIQGSANQQQTKIHYD